ncbi:unnamed protein product, partial [Urochloa humidicola]
SYPREPFPAACEDKRTRQRKGDEAAAMWACGGVAARVHGMAARRGTAPTGNLSSAFSPIRVQEGDDMLHQIATVVWHI